MSKGLFTVLEEADITHTQFTDDGIFEFNSVGADIVNNVNALEKLSVGNEYIKKLRNSIESDNFYNQMSYMQTKATIDNLSKSLNIRRSFIIATESTSNLKVLALEGIGSFLAEIWRLIKKTVMYFYNLAVKMYNAIANLFSKRKVKTESILSKAEKLKAKGAKLKEGVTTINVFKEAATAYEDAKNNKLHNETVARIFGKKTPAAYAETVKHITDEISDIVKQIEDNQISGLAKKIDTIMKKIEKEVVIFTDGKDKYYEVDITYSEKKVYGLKSGELIIHNPVRNENDKIKYTIDNLDNIIRTIKNVNTLSEANTAEFNKFKTAMDNINKSINSINIDDDNDGEDKKKDVKELIEKVRAAISLLNSQITYNFQVYGKLLLYSTSTVINVVTSMIKSYN